MQLATRPVVNGTRDGGVLPRQTAGHQFGSRPQSRVSGTELGTADP